MKPHPENNSPEIIRKPDHKGENTTPTHLGSSNAFEKTENPLSRDADDISDEKLDELIGN